VAFRDFTYPAVVGQLGLTERTEPDLFAGVPGLAPGETLRAALPAGIQLGTGAHTEVARMIWMVGPVLSDLWVRYRGRVCLNAGAEFDADPAARLTGYCDFVIGRGPQRPQVTAPVLVIFEAERDSIPDGLGQCVAGMVGAQRFNARNNAPIDPIFGCVTTGSLWKFLRLDGSDLTIDLTEYQLAQVDRLLGILVHMIGPVPQPAAA
jgi:hypothetical protein